MSALLARSCFRKAISSCVELRVPAWFLRAAKLSAARAGATSVPKLWQSLDLFFSDGLCNLVPRVPIGCG
jgi:hypothetical protein